MSASSREPVVIGSSILAGLQVLVAGSALADVLDPKIASLLALVVAALTAGWGAYTRGLVTPVADVAARETHAGDLVAGEAAEVQGIAPEGAPVDVLPEPTSSAAERVASPETISADANRYRQVRDNRGRFAPDTDGDGIADTRKD